MANCIMCGKETDNIGTAFSVSDHKPVSTVAICVKCVDILIADDEDEYRLLVKSSPPKGDANEKK